MHSNKYREIRSIDKDLDLPISELYVVGFLVIAWLTDYMRYSFREAFKDFDEDEFPEEYKSEAILVKNAIEDELDIRFKSVNHVTRNIVDEQYVFNEILDREMQPYFDQMRTSLMKAFLKAEYSHSKELTELIVCDIVYQFIYTLIDKFIKQFFNLRIFWTYQNFKPNFSVRKIGIVDSDATLYQYLQDIYKDVFNGDKVKIDVNSKKIGLESLTNTIIVMLFNITFLLKVWKACDTKTILLNIKL